MYGQENRQAQYSGTQTLTSRKAFEIKDDSFQMQAECLFGECGCVRGPQSSPNQTKMTFAVSSSAYDTLQFDSRLNKCRPIYVLDTLFKHVEVPLKKLVSSLYHS